MYRSGSGDDWGDAFGGSLGHDDATGNETTVLGQEGAEDERADGGELDEDVNRWAGGVLERVADGVTADGGSVGIVTLLDLDQLAIWSLQVEHASLNVLLGVIPSATGVGGGEGNLDAGDDAAGEDTVGGLVAEEAASEEWGDNDEDAWRNHLLEGGVRGDGDAVFVIGGEGWVLGHLGELSADLLEHVLGGITDGLHGHGGEPVWEHGTDEETSEGVGLKDVDFEGVCGLLDWVLGVWHHEDGVANAGHESTEEGEGDKASRANGEALADGSSGVSSGVKGISSLADGLVEVGHLSNTAGVVRDWAVSVDGEGNGEAAEHANGSKSDTVHGGELEGNEDSDGQTEDGDDAGEVAEGEAVDDVGGTAELASLSELLGWSVFFGGVVLGDEADGETGPETEDDADVTLPWGRVVVLSSEHDANTFLWEHVDGGDDEDGHEDGGNPQLDLQSRLDVLNLDVGEELAEERGDDSDGGHNEGEVDGLRSGDHADGSGGDDESSAGGLSEGAEKISAHASDVTNIVTDVVSNGAWVLGGVLWDGSLDLASEISTDISSLGVDSATDSAEESDSGATETVARDELEQVLDLDRSLRVEGSFVGEDEDLEDEESKTDEAESEDLATLEGDLESFESVDVAEVGGLDVADGGDHHADVAAEHGGTGANDEGEHGEGELVVAFPRHVDGAEDDDGEESAEEGECEVLFFEESDGTLKIDISFKFKLEWKFG